MADKLVLIACEESQAICREMRKLGLRAYSCDLQVCSGGRPEWHLQGDVLTWLDKVKWDLIIAHPPCTYLSSVAAGYHSLKKTTLDKINARTLLRTKAMQFFMRFAMASCDKIAIENPVGVMNTAYRKPDQIIHPYFFAESVEDTENYVTKTTCLWLKGLPLLKATNDLPKPDNGAILGHSPSGKAYCWVDKMKGGKDRSKNRSKTFPGIAKAIAEQWGGLLC